LKLKKILFLIQLENVKEMGGVEQPFKDVLVVIKFLPEK
jgi:hypothetical protein